jgi:hypothetical protein
VQRHSLTHASKKQGCGAGVTVHEPSLSLPPMCADIVTNPARCQCLRFKFPDKNGIVRQSLHGSINEKKQFSNNK